MLQLFKFTGGRGGFCLLLDSLLLGYGRKEIILLTTYSTRSVGLRVKDYSDNKTISRSSQCFTHGVTKAVVCVIPFVG